MIQKDALAGDVQNLVYIGFVADHATHLLLAGKPQEALVIADAGVDRARLTLNGSRTQINELSTFCAAQISRCRILRTLKRGLPKARTDLDEVVALEESFTKDFTSEHAHRGRLADALLERALIESAMGLQPEALADAQRARQTLDELTKAKPQNVAYRETLAETLGELARLKTQAGETAGVESILEQAIALETQVLELNPDNLLVKTRLQRQQVELRSLKTPKPRGPDSAPPIGPRESAGSNSVLGLLSRYEGFHPPRRYHSRR